MVCIYLKGGFKKNTIIFDYKIFESVVQGVHNTHTISFLSNDNNILEHKIGHFKQAAYSNMESSLTIRKVTLIRRMRIF